MASPDSIRELMGTSLRDGRYAISGVIGSGSQGATLEAVDKRDGRLVAIKRFQVRGARSWKDVELAEREARVLSRLSHRLLPSALEHFEEDGALYLVMDKIEGDPLSKVGTMSRDEVISFLYDADEVLSYLHSQAPPIFHRDVKPGNVIRRPPRPELKEVYASYLLVDFGSVRESLKPAGGSTVVGTFGYMAPEQFQGRALPQTDVYGVGATAIRMLTGLEPEKLPHKGLAIDVAQALGPSDPAMVRLLQALLEPNPDVRPSRIRPLLAGMPRPHSVAPDGGDRAAAPIPTPSPQTHVRPAGSQLASERVHRRGRRPHRRGRRRHRRGHRRHGFPPMLAAFGVLGLTLARIAVSLSLQVLLPVMLTLLALIIPGVRPAVKQVRRAARRADRAMLKARDFVAGRMRPPEAEERAEQAQSAGPRIEDEPERGPRIHDDGRADNPVDEAIEEVDAAFDELFDAAESEPDKRRR